MVFDLKGKVIRICMSEECGVIYLDGGENHTYIKPCKKCEHSTGFFESMEHFYKYIDNYGIDLDNIIDKGLQQEAEQHYG